MIMRITLILALFFALGCTQTIHLGYVWDKNDESENVKNYDLFVLVLPDSAEFWTLTEWPVDTLSYVQMDSTIHFPNMLATIAHITSPIDTVLYEFDQKMSQGFLRGYILAADSLGNTSTIAPSINVVYIGDREAPSMPGRNQILKW